MAKASYIGVSSKAHKIKKAYIGVGGKARKIKKAYIGDSNGKARLWWSGLEGKFIVTANGQSNTTSRVCFFETSNFVDFSIHVFSNTDGIRGNSIAYTDKLTYFKGAYYFIAQNSTGSYEPTIYKTTDFTSITVIKQLPVTTYSMFGYLYVTKDGEHLLYITPNKSSRMWTNNGTDWFFTTMVAGNCGTVSVGDDNGYLYASDDAYLYKIPISEFLSESTNIQWTAVRTLGNSNSLAYPMAIDGGYIYSGYRWSSNEDLRVLRQETNSYLTSGTISGSTGASTKSLGLVCDTNNIFFRNQYGIAKFRKIFAQNENPLVQKLTINRVECTKLMTIDDYLYDVSSVQIDSITGIVKVTISKYDKDTLTLTQETKQIGSIPVDVTYSNRYTAYVTDY